MKRFIIILFMCLSFIGYSQKFNGVVLDAYDDPIEDASIVNIRSKDKATTNRDGLFIISAKKYDSLRIIIKDKSPFYYIVPDFEENDNQIYFINADDLKLQSFDGVTVTSERIKPVVERFNANVLDYYLYKNGRVLTLTSFRNKHKLNLEIADEVYADFNLTLNKPSEIYLDYHENLHIIGKDSAYQFILSENELKYIDGTSTNIFDELLRPVLYTNDEYMLTGDYYNHNKIYKLIKTYKDNQHQSVIHTVADLEALKTANNYYYSIINLYNRTTRAEHNIISNGIWTGDLTHLGETSDLIQLITWFKNIVSSELNVNTFIDDSLLTIFDFENQIIQKIKLDDTSKEEIKINSTLNLKRFKVIKDDVTNEYYCYNKKNPTINLYKIDPENGEVNSALEMNEVTFPKNLKVFNGWLYFIKINDALFNKLYKIKVE